MFVISCCNITLSMAISLQLTPKARFCRFVRRQYHYNSPPNTTLKVDITNRSNSFSGCIFATIPLEEIPIIGEKVLTDSPVKRNLVILLATFIVRFMLRELGTCKSTSSFSAEHDYVAGVGWHLYRSDHELCKISHCGLQSDRCE